MISYDNKKWLRILFAWKGTVIWGVFPRMIFFILWTTMITLAFHYGYLPTTAKIDMVVYSIVGLALGLLLVFRTNSSYDRYWEGRKLLGATTNACRNVAFLLHDLVARENHKLRTELAELLSSFNFAVKERLRDGVEKEHLPMLREEFLNEAFRLKHVPNGIMKQLHQKLSEVKDQGDMTDYNYIAVVKEMSALIDNMGGMERIRFTPVPFAYANHLQIFIMFFLLALPFGLYDKFHWLAVPVIGIISFILLGINEIGVEIEDPFGDDPNDLPVDTICENIQKNVYEIMEVELPEKKA